VLRPSDVVAVTTNTRPLSATCKTRHLFVSSVGELGRPLGATGGRVELCHDDVKHASRAGLSGPGRDVWKLVHAVQATCTLWELSRSRFRTNESLSLPKKVDQSTREPSRVSLRMNPFCSP